MLVAWVCQAATPLMNGQLFNRHPKLWTTATDTFQLPPGWLLDTMTHCALSNVNFAASWSLHDPALLILVGKGGQSWFFEIETKMEMKFVHASHTGLCCSQILLTWGKDKHHFALFLQAQSAWSEVVHQFKNKQSSSFGVMDASCIVDCTISCFVWVQWNNQEKIQVSQSTEANSKKM